METNLFHKAHKKNSPEEAKSHLAKDTPNPIQDKKGQASNVYELTSIFKGIKWMHAVCKYPVKSTWIKAIRTGNYVGWPLLSIENVCKHYPEIEETPKGHLNQSRKNVRSTKIKSNSTP